MANWWSIGVYLIGYLAVDELLADNSASNADEYLNLVHLLVLHGELLVGGGNHGNGSLKVAKPKNGSHVINDG